MLSKRKKDNKTTWICLPGESKHHINKSKTNGHGKAPPNHQMQENNIFDTNITPQNLIQKKVTTSYFMTHTSSNHINTNFKFTEHWHQLLVLVAIISIWNISIQKIQEKHPLYT